MVKKLDAFKFDGVAESDNTDVTELQIPGSLTVPKFYTIKVQNALKSLGKMKVEYFKTIRISKFAFTICFYDIYVFFKLHRIFNKKSKYLRFKSPPL